MWKKFAEQLPAVALTVVIIGGAAYWLHTRTVQEMAVHQQQEIAALRDQTTAELRASSEENRREIAAVNTLLKDAIQKRSADVFLNEDEVAQLNQERVSQLAELIAQRLQPNNPLPKTPEEAEAAENQQIDRVSGRLADRIQPILAEMSRDQNLTREQLSTYSQRISDQISVVLTTEMAKNQQLNNSLLATHSLAQESLLLSQEVTALYLSSFKDQGVLTRLLTLPANVVRDASKLSLVGSSERKKIEEDLVAKMNSLQDRLRQVSETTP